MDGDSQLLRRGVQLAATRGSGTLATRVWSLVPLREALGLSADPGRRPGLHLCTFNQHETVLSVLDGCGLPPNQGTTTEKEPA